jgi:two-component sensor histidine kinase
MSLRDSVTAFVAASTDADLVFLRGGGEMGARIRAHDWSKTRLGPAASWPQSLKACVRIMLASRQPMFIWWGEEMINLYNDAYKAIVGGKHPEALAMPAADVWREIWDETGPRARSAFDHAEGTYDEALQLIMERNGYKEETYYTFSYSPVPNDDGRTGGILCANTDETQRIIGERRVSLLRELAARTWDANTVEHAYALCAECLGANPRDIPFALIYALGEDKCTATLAGRSGIKDTHAAAVKTISLDDETTWPIAQSITQGMAVSLGDLGARFGALPRGAWDAPPTRAAILPIAAPGHGTSGVLIVGCNPYRPYDDSYQGFLTLVAGQIAAAVVNVRAYEQEVKRGQALREFEAHQKLLLDELNHRVKNTLATVQAIAMQTLRGEDITHRDAFLARLFALSAQHDLLTQDKWESASLKEVVWRALKPYEEKQGKRCTVEGPDMRLPPKRALSLGLAFHELATNAAKHGALSTGTGTVEVSWNIEPETGRLKLRWQEKDGPRVAEPKHKGFGRRLIEHGLSHELSAQIRLRFPPSGVVCEWEMPQQQAH